MDYSSFDTTASPQIRIQNISGDLIIKGWERSEIRVDSDSKNGLHTSFQDNQLEVSCNSSAAIRAPIDTEFIVEKVNGDLHMKAIEGNCNFSVVRGNASLKNTGNVTISHTNGNLVCKQAMGVLQIERVSGNLNCKQIENNIVVMAVDGNAVIQEIEGDVKLALVNGNLKALNVQKDLDVICRGNATVRSEMDIDANYSITASGNVDCRIETELGLHMIFDSKARKINIDLPDLKQESAQRVFEYNYLNPDSEIRINADGKIDFELRDSLSSGEADFDFSSDIANFTDEINQLVNMKLEENLVNFNAQMEEFTNKFEPNALYAERMIRKNEEKIHRQAEQVRQRAERQARLAAERVKAQYRTNRYSAKTEPANDPVSDEERQMVLLMLERKQISIEDAESLLAAMEGREHTPSPKPAAPQAAEPPVAPETPIEPDSHEDEE